MLRRRTLLAGAAGLPSAAHAASMLPHGGFAPEFSGIAAWLNGPALTMTGLRGRVVLIEFWDYACINCIRSLPLMTRWDAEYRARGLVLVGVHTPEFAFERDAGRVQAATARFGIRYTVALDNDAATWRAFGTKYWPTQFVIDTTGRIALRHVGEGAYEETENAIRALLAAGPPVPPEDGADLSGVHTPELYFGLDRLAFLASTEPPRAGEMRYSMPPALAVDRFALGGFWDLDGERARLVGGEGAVKARFRAGKVFLTARSAAPAPIAVAIDGRAQPPVTVRESRLYTLFDGNAYGDHMVTLGVETAGFEAFTLSFG